MGDRGHNRHAPKRGGAVSLSRSAGNPSNVAWAEVYFRTKWRLHPSSRLAGCHSPRNNISTNYYLVVEMHTVTVRSDDARYLLN